MTTKARFRLQRDPASGALVCVLYFLKAFEVNAFFEYPTAALDLLLGHAEAHVLRIPTMSCLKRSLARSLALPRSRLLASSPSLYLGASLSLA